MSWLRANGNDGVWPRTFYAEGLEMPPPCPALAGEVEADLCVVGGGITGLSAALHGAQAGMSVVVLEAQRVGWGASGRNGGQVGLGFNWDQTDLEARLGAEAARGLWDLSVEAVGLTRSLIAAQSPEAGYRAGIVYAAGNEREFRGYPAWVEDMNRRYGTDLEMLDRGTMAAQLGTEAYAGGVLDRGSGHCNPLAYVLGLARACRAAGVVIHEGSEVTGLGDRVETAGGSVRARFVLLATNGYPGPDRRVSASVLPINNYIAVTEPLAEMPIKGGVAVADSRFVVNYFRPSADGRLIYGGGESYGRRFPRDIAGKVRRNLARVYPDLAKVRFDYAWGGTLAVTATRLPLLREIAPQVFVSAGYSGHGLALSGLFGALCVEAMQGRQARFDLAASLPVPALPGGRWLGPWAAQAGMLAGAWADRLRG